MSITFNWTKQCIIGQNFVNKCTSNGVSYKMLGFITPEGVKFASVLLDCCCSHVILILTF